MAKGKKTGGRQPGSPNKDTKALREMILEALEKQGGVDYLQKAATEQPGAFLTLLGKVLPMTVQGDASAPIQIVVKRPF